MRTLKLDKDYNLCLDKGSIDAVEYGPTNVKTKKWELTIYTKSRNCFKHYVTPDQLGYILVDLNLSLSSRLKFEMDKEHLNNIECYLDRKSF